MEKRIDKLLVSSSNYLVGNIKCDTTQDTSPFKCAVSTCKNKFTSFEDHQLASFHFHNFPIHPTVNQNWKALCKLPPEASTKNLKVCSDHFNLDDYDRNLRAELLNPGHKRSLKETALPTVIVATDNIVNGSVSLSEISDTGGANDQLRSVVHVLKRDIRLIERKINRTKKGILKQNYLLAEFKKSLKTIDYQIEKRTEKILGSIFSEAQLNLLKGGQKVYWSDDDLAQAFTLRHMGGKELYLYLKNTLNYPLPSLSCVQAWAGNNN